MLGLVSVREGGMSRKSGDTETAETNFPQTFPISSYRGTFGKLCLLVSTVSDNDYGSFNVLASLTTAHIVLYKKKEAEIMSLGDFLNGRSVQQAEFLKDRAQTERLQTEHEWHEALISTLRPHGTQIPTGDRLFQLYLSARKTGGIG